MLAVRGLDGIVLNDAIAKSHSQWSLLNSIIYPLKDCIQYNKIYQIKFI